MLYGCRYLHPLYYGAVNENGGLRFCLIDMFMSFSAGEKLSDGKPDEKKSGFKYLR